ncbi:MAG TPA: hypothetical protein VKC63_03395 [Solirubrobacterales bacterium]|nr:hypothetical protein [Solirubrobacterales bacterium]
MAITTTKTNLDAHRFYERQGFSQGFVIYHGKQPRLYSSSRNLASTPHSS